MAPDPDDASRRFAEEARAFRETFSKLTVAARVVGHSFVHLADALEQLQDTQRLTEAPAKTLDAWVHAIDALREIEGALGTLRLDGLSARASELVVLARLVFSQVGLAQVEALKATGKLKGAEHA